MNTALDIIVVEDNALLRDEVVDCLTTPEWRVRGVGSGSELDQAMQERPADILVLDLNLPQEDGISIARRMRAAHPRIGIVMMTARDEIADRAIGYGAGADVYLTKPTNIGELESVLFNLALRMKPREPDAPLVLSERLLRLVSADGRSVGLTNIEYRVFRMLVLADQHELDYAALCAQLYPDEALSQAKQRLAVVMTRARQKVQEGLDVAQCVKSVRAQGYRLMVPIQLES